MKYLFIMSVFIFVSPNVFAQVTNVNVACTYEIKDKTAAKTASTPKDSTGNPTEKSSHIGEDAIKLSSLMNQSTRVLTDAAGNYELRIDYDRAGSGMKTSEKLSVTLIDLTNDSAVATKQISGSFNSVTPLTLIKSTDKFSIDLKCKAGSDWNLAKILQDETLKAKQDSIATIKPVMETKVQPADSSKAK